MKKEKRLVFKFWLLTNRNTFGLKRSEMSEKIKKNCNKFQSKRRSIYYM